MKTISILFTPFVAILMSISSSFANCPESFDEDFNRLIRAMEAREESRKIKRAENLIEGIRVLKLSGRKLTKSDAKNWLSFRIQSVPEQLQSYAEEIYSRYLALSGKKTPAEIVIASKVIELAEKLERRIIEFSRKDQAAVEAMIETNIGFFTVVLMKAYRALTIRKADDSPKKVKQRFDEIAAEINIHFSTTVLGNLRSQAEAEALLMNSKFQNLLKALLFPREDSPFSSAQQFVIRGLVMSGLMGIQEVVYRQILPSRIIRMFEVLKKEDQLFEGSDEAIDQKLLEDIPHFAEDQYGAHTIRQLMEIMTDHL